MVGKNKTLFVLIAVQEQNKPSHRVCRAAAITLQIGQIRITVLVEVSLEGIQEVVKKRNGQLAFPDGVGQRQKDGILRRLVQAGVQCGSPIAQRIEVGGFVRQIVGVASKGVNGINMMADPARQEYGSYGKILVVCGGQSFTVLISF